ncbi:hypothetical protein BGX33_008989 [Mortierella sp. NVP41]|nr:hypothetical protein BGX33_008989 [Mortierella sp. NVP41]
MLFSKSISVALTLVTIVATSIVEASPLRVVKGPVACSVDSSISADALSSNAVNAYIPVNERFSFYTDAVAGQLVEHETALVEKRASLSGGYNDWGCIPNTIRPRPIVLVHGLFATGEANWVYMGPRLAQAGYCVYAITYGAKSQVPFIAATDKMENGAAQLSAYINKVLAATKATKVDLVGHSEGSLMPRYYLKFLGGAAKVAKFTAFGSIVYGTSPDSTHKFFSTLGLYDEFKKSIDPICQACFQLLVGSDFLNNLNAGGVTVPGVKYQFIVSKFDEVVTPYTNGFIRDNNPNVHNVVLQDLCPFDRAGHILQMLDPIVFRKIDAFFTPSASQTINCLSALT